MFDYDSEHHYTAENTVSGPCSPQEVKWSHRHAMSWDDLKDGANILPQHEEQARREINKHLGYEPPPIISLRHEAFARALVEEFQQGRLTEEGFNVVMADHVKQIRNDDMQRGGWAAPYTEADYHHYNTYLVQFKERARERMVKKLQFEPDLEYSLDAELMLREQFTLEWFTDSIEQYTPFDAKAYTIVFYRMALGQADRDVANALDLMGAF